MAGVQLARLLCALVASAHAAPLPAALGSSSRSLLADPSEAAQPSDLAAPAEALQRLRVAVVLEGECQHVAPSEEDELACYHGILATCSATASDDDCFRSAAKKTPQCYSLFPKLKEKGGGSNFAAADLPYYKSWWVTLLAKIVPQLRALGWDNVQTVTKSDSEALAAADIIVLRYKESTVKKLLKGLRPSQRLVLLDKQDVSVVPGDRNLEHPQVMLFLKQMVLEPRELQRGPLFWDLSHTGLMIPQDQLAREGAWRKWSDAALNKIHAFLPMTVMHRYPWACGSGLGKARFMGFFHSSLGHTWAVPRLAERSIDVALLGRGSYKGKPGKYLTLHRTLGREAVQRFKAAHSAQFKVMVPETKMKDYPEYIRTLLDVKVLVSPWGWGEWSLKDFEAIMAGCLLVKPMAGRYKAYPDIYQPGETVLSTDQAFGNLTEVLLVALGDLDAAQRMADAAAATFRTHADPAVIAADFSGLLLGAAAREFGGAAVLQVAAGAVTGGAAAVAGVGAAKEVGAGAADAAAVGGATEAPKEGGSSELRDTGSSEGGAAMPIGQAGSTTAHLSVEQPAGQLWAPGELAALAAALSMPIQL